MKRRNITIMATANGSTKVVYNHDLDAPLSGTFLDWIAGSFPFDGFNDTSLWTLEDGAEGTDYVAYTCNTGDGDGFWAVYSTKQ